MWTLKAILRILFVSGPAILLAGYTVYWLNQFLLRVYDVHLHPLIYQTIALIAMWAAFELSTRSLINELKARRNNHEEPPN